MEKVRDGNDIHFVWEIVRNSQPEDLSKIVRSELILHSFSKKQQLSYEVVDVNKIRIELKREVTNEPGAYNLEFSYTILDSGFSDGLRNCCVDVDPCEIVTKSKYASISNEYAMTSEMAFAFKGDKGDPFTFDDFTPEQLESLKVKGDKGDAFTYEDFTPEQIESLKVKGDTGPMADVSMAVNESGELIATINN